MTDPLLDKLVRFQRPERVLTFAQQLSDRTLASIFGTDETGFQKALADSDRERTAAADQLAADPAVRENLDKLPFSQGDHLVAIGESSTADRLSWFELLGTLLTAERPDLDLRFDNLAISGATSTQVLAGLPAIRRSSADWIFCMLGANDAQRFDSGDGPRLVSASETVRNLHQLRSRALPRETARWVWVTPTPVDEDLVAEFPFFRSAGISWANADLTELSATLHELGDPVVDSASAVTSAIGDAHLEDGIHPSLAAHQALAAHTLDLLAAPDRE